MSTSNKHHQRNRLCSNYCIRFFLLLGNVGQLIHPGIMYGGSCELEHEWIPRGLPPGVQQMSRTFSAEIRPSIPSNLDDMCVYAVAVAAVAAAAAAAAEAPPPAPDKDPLPLMLLCLWTIFLQFHVNPGKPTCFRSSPRCSVRMKGDRREARTPRGVLHENQGFRDRWVWLCGVIRDSQGVREKLGHNLCMLFTLGASNKGEDRKATRSIRSW